MVTIPEGFRVDQIVATLAKKTDFSKKQYEKALADPSSIGLPAYAKGNAEGYLFPATYALPPNATPKSILSLMVKRWSQAAEDADLEGAAEKLGYTPARADDGREPRRGRVQPRRRPRQGRPGHLQPAGDRRHRTSCSRSTRP